MKTINSLLIFLTCSTLFLFSFKNSETEVRYYVAYGWENINYCDDKKLNTAWVYSNVVKVNCEYSSSQSVFNQFSEHYGSLYGKTRCRILVGSYAAGFDTYEEAAAFRREKIAEKMRSEKVAPIQIKNFSYFCK